MSNLVFIRRPETLRELNYCRNSWTTSELNDSTRGSRAIVKRIAYWGHSRLVDKLLNRSTILVADSCGAPGVLCGFLAHEIHGDTSYLHYLYVGNDFRRHGVARTLCAELQKNVIYTTKVPLVASLPVPPTWVFDDNYRWEK